jgi:hypothetical protein
MHSGLRHRDREELIVFERLTHPALKRKETAFLL